MILETATEGQSQYCYVAPQESDASWRDAIVSDDTHCEVSDYGHHNQAIAAAPIAADLIKTAGFDAPAVPHNLDSFVPATSGGGRGFRDPYLLEMIPWFAAVADSNGVRFDPETQLVRHGGWLLETGATDERFKKAEVATAFHDSCLHMFSYKINAFDAQLRKQGESCVLASLCAASSSFSVSCRAPPRYHRPTRWWETPQKRFQFFKGKGTQGR